MLLPSERQSGHEVTFAQDFSNLVGFRAVASHDVNDTWMNSKNLVVITSIRLFPPSLHMLRLSLNTHGVTNPVILFTTDPQRRRNRRGEEFVVYKKDRDGKSNTHILVIHFFTF